MRLDMGPLYERLADRDRLELVRQTHLARAKQIQARQGERVVPIKRGRKS
jgi:hypothetical protein